VAQRGNTVSPWRAHAGRGTAGAMTGEMLSVEKEGEDHANA